MFLNNSVRPCTFFIYEFDYSQTHYCLDMPASCRKLYAEDYFLLSNAEDARIFSKKPEFYVFYNGEESYPSDKTLNLSDAFIEKTEEPILELTVKVININKENRHPVLENCKTMYEYTLFVETVRRWKKQDFQNGFQKAVEECIANNTLKDYLKRKTKEVINMLLAEYDYETDIAVQRQESLMIGIEQGSYQKAFETAKNLLAMNLPIENIAQATGLSIEEIEKL